MTKKVLMVAFHFPPNSSIGAQRTFKTAEYLPKFGWEPIILTAKIGAYDAIEKTQKISPQLLDNTYRTMALDVKNHLSIKGKHFEWMKMIDRWTTWVPGAILKGKKIIKEQKPDVIWSTTPIPSAHIIANTLSQYYKIPWIADYRDPMSYHHYSTQEIKAKVLKSIDNMTMKNCNAAVFTTGKAMDLYRNAFPAKDPELLYCVENGFDENNWISIYTHNPTSISPLDTNKFSLFYSGVLYPNGRDPLPLFRAIHILKQENQLNNQNFELVFQGSGTGDQYRKILNQLELSELVHFTPSVPYLDSLYYMNQADALVLIQDKIFNLQIPGKLYEYFRSGKPVLAITHDESATAETIRHYELGSNAQTSEQIAAKLRHFLNSKPKQLTLGHLDKFSRETKTSEIANIFDQTLG